MIFARRALQRRLDELRERIGDDTVNGLVRKLNVPGRDRLATVWEVVVLHAFAQLGTVENEVALPSGRRPDLKFSNETLAFTADITTVSDEGLDNKNPIAELQQLVEAAKSKLGLPIGGLNVRIGPKETQLAGGTRRSLRMPEKAKLPAFMQSTILPEMRRQLATGGPVIAITIRDDEHDIEIAIDTVDDPSKRRFSSASYPSYDIPTIANSNPLFRALDGKRTQVRGADGLTGVIVADGDCTALQKRTTSWSGLSSQDIVRGFLRQNSSVGFVCLLTVHEDKVGPLRTQSENRRVQFEIIMRKGEAVPDGLDALFGAAVKSMPIPMMMPVNGALRARETGYGFGHHGGYQMSGRRVKVSLREMMELLAGIKDLEKWKAEKHWSLGLPGEANHSNPFRLRLAEGRLPSAITIIPGGENDSDDWIEFQFDGPDPAITPFK